MPALLGRAKFENAYNTNYMDLAALPDDILPLLAAGSNAILANLRVNRRFAAVCIIPPLERHAQVLRRGAFVLDLAANYDPVLTAPVLDAEDVTVLWEILGRGMSSVGAYKSTKLCSKSIVTHNHFDGNYYPDFEMDGINVGTHGPRLEFSFPQGCKKTDKRKLYVWHLGRTSQCVVINTTRGQVYWTGSRGLVKWVAERMNSALITRVRDRGHARFYNLNLKSTQQ